MGTSYRNMSSGNYCGDFPKTAMDVRAVYDAFLHRYVRRAYCVCSWKDKFSHRLYPIYAHKRRFSQTFIKRSAAHPPPPSPDYSYSHHGSSSTATIQVQGRTLLRHGKNWLTFPRAMKGCGPSGLHQRRTPAVFVCRRTEPSRVEPHRKSGACRRSSQAVTVPGSGRPMTGHGEGGREGRREGAGGRRLVREEFGSWPAA